MRRSIESLENVLTDSRLDRQVDMVLRRLSPGRYRAAASDGSVEFRRELSASGDAYEYRIDSISGHSPLATTGTDQLLGLHHERAQPFPIRSTNSYPHAFDQIAQFFDAEHAPDLVVQHTAGHHFDSSIGQHGSLGIVQARAPFIAAGAGVVARGTVDESARMIDVAPSIAWLLGVEIHPDGIGPTGRRRSNSLLRRQDGDPLADLFEFGGANHVVVLLLDGCNANVLYDAIEAGHAPAIAELAQRGSTLGRGLFASLPTATLANHTTASTGAHPGHSGVLHNMWFDRTRNATPDLLAMDQVFDAMVHLDPTIETIHQAIHRTRPDAFTAAMFEFCDTGADFSTFAQFRGGTPPPLPAARELAEADQEMIERSGTYSFMTSVDELATQQAIDVLARVDGNQLPALTWVSFSLPDESGHEAGPHSDMERSAIIDTDRRVRRIIDEVERAGAIDATAFLVFADHGMEENDPENVESWADALAGSGVPHRDVAGGFVYLEASQPS